MNGSSEEYLALTLENESKQALQQLVSSLSQCDLMQMCYAYKSRVKPEIKLVDKVDRKKKDGKPNYELTDITDVIGLRFVTLFRKDMPRVLSLLIQIIKHQEQLTPNPFKVDHFEEIIIYTASQHDDITPVIRDMLEEEDVSVLKNGGLKIEFSKQGYSSIHLVARLNNQVSRLSTESDIYYVPVEIQIRTVFEDAWGEIDHKYGYVVRTGKNVGSSIHNSEHVLSHLKILKKFSDACAEYADAIHCEATSDSTKEVDSGVVISVVADDDVIARLTELAVSQDSIDRFNIARNKRQEARDLMQNDRDLAISAFLTSAELSREGTEGIGEGEIDSTNLADYLLFYYLKMNEAICLLSTNISEHIKAAFHIYYYLINMYSDFPLLRMRLAQSYGKLGFVAESIMHYSKAQEQIDRFESAGCKFNDELPETDYRHVKKYLPKLYGFQLWYKAHYELNDDNELQEKITLLKRAYEVTSTQLEDVDEDQKASIYNNLLYYAVELEKYAELSDEDLLPIISNIETHFQLFEPLVDITTTDNLGYLDTLSKAYDYFEMIDKATEVANRIIAITLDGSKNDSYDQAEMLEIAQEAFSLRQEYIKKQKH